MLVPQTEFIVRRAAWGLPSRLTQMRKMGVCSHTFLSVASDFSGRDLHLTSTCLENNGQLVFIYAEM